MKRSTVFIVVALLLVLPTLGSANPNGVGRARLTHNAVVPATATPT